MVNDVGHCKVGTACEYCGLASACLAHFAMAKTEHVNKKQFSLQADDIVAKADTPLDYLYVVKSGSLKHTKMTEDGHEQVADFYLPGDIIGLDCLGVSHKHCCNLVALESSTLCAIKLDDFEKLSHSHITLQKKLMSLLSQKLLARTQALLIQHQHAEQKLAAFLLDISTRLKKIGRAYIGYNLSMSRHDIGNYLHLSTETVSRLFSKFHCEQLIRVQKKHVVLKDIKRLYEKTID